MNIKCGTDIIEIARIKKSIDELGDSFINKIYTKNEISYCESKGKQKYQHYAARFAAKEATFKAISDITDDKYSLNWQDFEVINDEKGRPMININKNIGTVKSIDVSLSHCKEYATANVAILL